MAHQDSLREENLLASHSGCLMLHCRQVQVLKLVVEMTEKTSSHVRRIKICDCALILYLLRVLLSNFVVRRVARRQQNSESDGNIKIYKTLHCAEVQCVHNTSQKWNLVVLITSTNFWGD